MALSLLLLMESVILFSSVYEFFGDMFPLEVDIKAWSSVTIGSDDNDMDRLTTSLPALLRMVGR